MSTEMNNETTTTETLNNEQSPTPQLKTAAQQLMGEFQQKLENSGDLVKSRWLDRMVNEEVDERVTLLDIALKTLTAQERELKKLGKADQVLYNSQHEIVQQYFSEKQHKELKEAEDKYRKLSDALNLALTKNNFSKLKEMNLKK